MAFRGCPHFVGRVAPGQRSQFVNYGVGPDPRDGSFHRSGVQRVRDHRLGANFPNDAEPGDRESANTSCRLSLRRRTSGRPMAPVAPAIRIFIALPLRSRWDDSKRGAGQPHLQACAAPSEECRIEPYFPNGVVSSVSLVSTMNTASSLAGSVSLPLALTSWRSPGISEKLSPAL